MGVPINTRYRFVASKDLQNIVLYFLGLRYRVEMKGLVVKKDTFYQTFILPDDESLKEAKYGNLDLNTEE